MPPLSTLALLFESFCGFQGRGELIGAMDGPGGTGLEFSGKAIGGLAQSAGRAIGIARRADDQYIGLIIVEQARNGRPVDAMIIDQHSGTGGSGCADRIAGGDTDATQSEIESEYDLGSRLRHGLL
jgi:hypothetical protein